MHITAHKTCSALNLYKNVEAPHGEWMVTYTLVPLLMITAGNHFLPEKTMIMVLNAFFLTSKTLMNTYLLHVFDRKL